MFEMAALQGISFEKFHGFVEFARCGTFWGSAAVSFFMNLKN